MKTTLPITTETLIIIVIYTIIKNQRQKHITYNILVDSEHGN